MQPHQHEDRFHAQLDHRESADSAPSSESRLVESGTVELQRYEDEDCDQAVAATALVGETRSPRRVSPDVEVVPNAEKPILPGSPRPSPAQRGRGEPGTDLGHEVLGCVPESGDPPVHVPVPVPVPEGRNGGNGAADRQAWSGS